MSPGEGGRRLSSVPGTRAVSASGSDFKLESNLQRISKPWRVATSTAVPWGTRNRLGSNIYSFWEGEEWSVRPVPRLIAFVVITNRR
jgi:hypothetical protein